MQEDLKKIKKYYGEKMMHLCRDLFPTILEDEGRLFSLISSKFPYSRFLYEDIINGNKVKEFQDYIYSLITQKENLKESNEDPFTLMNKAGYTLYECHDNDDVGFFKKYYADGEKLCTFRDERCKTHYVFFAVKKNVDEIHRENKPQREDKYGRSVISIQFTKGKMNVLSIKNRYNHHVENPDATYNNNLENIISGLTDSFAKKYNLNIIYNKESFCMDNYVLAPDGKFYRYNYEINNVFYCPNNIIISNDEVKFYEKEKYLIIDYFILDLVNKKVSFFKDNIVDGFVTDEIFKKIEIINTDSGKKVKLYGKSITIIELDKYNRIIKYESNCKEIYTNFLSYNKILEEFYDDDLEIVYDNFLTRNNSLKVLHTPNLRIAGSYFIEDNEKLNKINFPYLERVGAFFLRNSCVKTVSLPNLVEVDSGFMQLNKDLEVISLPKLKKVGSYFLFSNANVYYINFPCLEIVGHDFMTENKMLRELNLPNLRYTDDGFISNNDKIEKINLPNIVTIGDNFLYYNNNLTRVSLPSVNSIGEGFLCHNLSVKEIDLPMVQTIGDYFLIVNVFIKEINFPKVEKIGRDFLYNNADIEKVFLPKLEECGGNFLISANKVSEYNFNSLCKTGHSFMQSMFGFESDNTKSFMKILKRKL